ncbi:MAG: class I SAM-dependent methyltransferase [Planctomycetota bacterium]|nr:class I SAM-dependent methyltransferase [Planctomycetota bacterium]
MSSESLRQRIIASWSLRAKAYHSLTRDWELFEIMAKRLIENASFSKDHGAKVLDLACGSGLVSEVLFGQFPRVKLHLCDPSETMLNLSRDLFGDRVQSYLQKAARDIKSMALNFDAILCSAAFHLMDEDAVLESVAQRLKPGAVFVCNLWGHSFDETAGLDSSQDWRPVVRKALKESGQDIPKWPASGGARLRSRQKLREIAEKHGLELDLCQVDKDLVPGAFTIAFLAMRESWPADMDKDTREAVLARAMELMPEQEPCYTVRLRFRK